METPERIARAFHEAYEKLAPMFGYETREANAKPWIEVPTQNRELMKAVVSSLIVNGVIVPGDAFNPVMRGTRD